MKMEALGNEGKVDEAMELSKTIEELKKKKKDLEVFEFSVYNLAPFQDSALKNLILHSPCTNNRCCFSFFLQ